MSSISDKKLLANNHVWIDGIALKLDEIVDSSFLAPAKVTAQSKIFLSSAPFPHIVFEDLFSPILLELINSEFDRLDWTDWKYIDEPRERILETLPNTCLGPATQLYFNTIYSGYFLEFLEGVTGIKGLIPDPKLHNGGLHEVPTGGKFALHIDFNRHWITGLDMRATFITYLNKDWDLSYGGAIELWDMKENKCQVEIEPVFGRSILFLQSSKSLHGLPKPIAAPNGRPRHSAIAYYYSNGRPDEEAAAYHGTIFAKPITFSRNEKVINSLKYLTPPFLWDGMRKLAEKFVGLLHAG